MALNRSAGTSSDNSIGVIWNIEKLIRQLTITKREDDPKLVGMIAHKISQLKQQFPDEARIYLMKGMLHEKLNENRAALLAYKEVRKKFPYCWQAYIYPVSFLKTKHRYGEMRKILQPMINLIYDETTPKNVKPNAKFLQEANHLLNEAEQFLENERRKNQRLAAEARKKRVEEKANQKDKEEQLRPEAIREQRKAEKAKKLEKKKQLEQAQSEIKQQQLRPDYNPFSVLADDVEVKNTNQPLVQPIPQATMHARLFTKSKQPEPETQSQEHAPTVRVGRKR